MFVGLSTSPAGETDGGGRETGGVGRTAGEHSRLISKGVTDVAMSVFEKDGLAEQGRGEEPAVGRQQLRGDEQGGVPEAGGRGAVGMDTG